MCRSGDFVPWAAVTCWTGRVMGWVWGGGCVAVRMWGNVAFAACSRQILHGNWGWQNPLRDWSDSSLCQTFFVRPHRNQTRLSPPISLPYPSLCWMRSLGHCPDIVQVGVLRSSSPRGYGHPSRWPRTAGRMRIVLDLVTCLHFLIVFPFFPDVPSFEPSPLFS